MDQEKQRPCRNKMISAKGDIMLIEIFTNGKVIIDGQDAGKSYRAEEALYDYLVNPSGFTAVKNTVKKNKPA